MMVMMPADDSQTDRRPSRM